MVDDIGTQTHREEVNATTTQTNMKSFWCNVSAEEARRGVEKTPTGEEKDKEESNNSL